MHLYSVIPANDTSENGIPIESVRHNLLVHWANVLEHRLHGSNVKCLTSIMMVRVRLGLGYCLVATYERT